VKVQTTLQLKDLFKHLKTLTLQFHLKDKAVYLFQLKEVEAILVTKAVLKSLLDFDHL